MAVTSMDLLKVVTLFPTLPGKRRKLWRSLFSLFLLNYFPHISGIFFVLISVNYAEDYVSLLHILDTPLVRRIF